jgi:flagellar biosynthetic protein FliO
MDSLATTQGGLLSDIAIWRSLGMLLVVLVLLVGAVWFLRRIQRGGSARSLDLEILGRLPLTQKQFLSVVRVGEECWVLGVTDGSIQYIGPYQGEWPQTPTAKPASGQPGFAGMLENKLRNVGRGLTRGSETSVEAGR